MNLDVTGLAYKPGWSFKIGGPSSRYLCVYASTPDSNNPSRDRLTQHMFEMPAEPMTVRESVRWVFDKVLLCELHEAGEFFTVDGFRPFFPNHQDEGSPYELVERWESQ